MRVLVTGGAGYIGSVLVEHLLNVFPDCQVTVLDNLLFRQTSLIPACSNPRFKFRYGDVQSQEMLTACVRDANVVIPLAAVVGAPACEQNQQLATAINYEQIVNIVRAIRQDQLLILPQTNSGYGSNAGIVCTEETPLQPISHYGKTKGVAETAVLENGGISLRLATVFGVSPRMRLDLLVNNFVYRAAADGFLVLFEPHFIRNYIHVRDVAYTFEFMIREWLRGAPHRGQAFNVGLTNANLSKMELAKLILKHYPLLSIQCDTIVKDPDQRNYIVSNAKLEQLGWVPKYTLDDGIVELQKAYPMLAGRLAEFTNVT